MGFSVNVEKIQPVSSGSGFERDLHAYDLFEEKYRLLESLTRRQLELIEPFSPRRVLDVGCDTGTSAMVLHNGLSSGGPLSIFAIEISNTMFLKAKSRYGNIPGLYFVHGEADNIENFFREGFDGIFYTPSLFQIPNFQESIRQAASLLVPGGVVSICLFSGLFIEDGEQPIGEMNPEMRRVPGPTIRKVMDSVFGPSTGFRFTEVDFRFEATEEILLEFLTIPIHSHPMFPKLSNVERTPRIQEVCSELEEKEGRVFIGWKFFTARKEGRMDS